MLTPQEREFQLGLQFLWQLGPWISLAESPFPLPQCLAFDCPTGRLQNVPSFEEKNAETAATN